MNIGLLAAAAAIIAAVARFAIAVRKGSSSDQADRTFIGTTLLAALAGSAIGVGLATVPYPFLHEGAPDFAKAFYKEWPTDPLFICMAGLAFAVCGFQGIRAEFRSGRSGQGRQAHSEE